MIDPSSFLKLSEKSGGAVKEVRFNIVLSLVAGQRLRLILLVTFERQRDRYRGIRPTRPVAPPSEDDDDCVSGAIRMKMLTTIKKETAPLHRALASTSCDSCKMRPTERQPRGTR